MNHIALIELLADGRFYSGDELGASLGVSRTAVWKQLPKLAELGVELEKVKGKGYRIPGGLDLLHREEFLRLLSDETSSLLGEVDFPFDIDSTNRGLSGNSGDWDEGRFYICSAERQTAGRGRRGRQWVSPLATSIYLSMGLVFSEGISRLEGLSLAVGVAIARVLKGYGVEGVQLKWPNDVQLNGQKICGVLVELEGEIEAACRVIVGVGLNVYPSEQLETIDQPWISLAEVMPQPPTRTELLARLVDSLVVAMEDFKRCGFAAFRHEWQEFDSLIGLPVTLSGSNQSGIAAGVSDQGNLCLDIGGEITEVVAGEVSVRAQK